jgi:hypothetical protein
VSGLYGDVTGLSVCVSGLTDEERTAGVEISALVDHKQGVVRVR